ncbi:MAG TPA: NUDIX hydrolase [Woeseiaceae bacterium]
MTISMEHDNRQVPTRQCTDPAPSATVVLVRNNQGSPEILLVRRHARTAFGTNYVFPGGLVETCDRHSFFDSRLTADDACRCLGMTEGALEYYSAAIRELFEETGVLLARDPQGRMPPAALRPAVDELHASRYRLIAQDTRWPEFLAQNDLTLAVDAISYFAWWITPTARPRRFSTRFFLAMMPDGQTACHDGIELTDSRWVTAAAALEAGKRGDLILPPPTLATLGELAAFQSVDEVKAWADERARTGVAKILPIIVSRHGKETILMPDHCDYAEHAARSGNDGR